MAKIVKDEKKKSAKVHVTFRGDKAAGKDLSFDIDDKIVTSAAPQGKTLTLGLDKGVSEVKLGERTGGSSWPSIRPRRTPC